MLAGALGSGGCGGGPGPAGADASPGQGQEDGGGTGTADGGHGADGGGDGSGGDGGGGDGGGGDGGGGDGGGGDGGGGDGGGGDGGGGDDGGGAIGGGPCLSGAEGATAYRVRWAGSGGTAYVVYEVNGLPDTSRDHTGSYGYQIGFSPSYVDTFLGEGGLLLNSSNFVDMELSTAGLAAIDRATLSIYGRSYHTTTSGSFNWQTFVDVGASPANLVSNVAPYQWYSADMTSALEPGDSGVLIRLKAGPSSGSLVVHRIELCLQAQ